METFITLSPTQCALRFADGTQLTVTEEGVICLTRPEATLICEPMRLKRDLRSFGSKSQSVFFGSEKIELSRDLSFSLIVDYASERLRVELFFQEKEGTAKRVSGCYITKEQDADWAIRFAESDRFLCNLSKLFIEPTEQNEGGKRKWRAI